MMSDETITIEDELAAVESKTLRKSVVPITPPEADWNPIEEAFLRRRSIRRYKSRQVPAHLIRRILEIGRFAPSQGNCQPWKFVVVRDKKMIAEMEAYCLAECKRLSASLNYTNYPLGTLKRMITKFKARLLNRLNHNLVHPVPMAAVYTIAQDRFTVFHKAPTVILLLMDQRGIGSPELDVGIVGTNIVMAAQSLGLGTCWVGFAKLLGNSKEWSERLGAEFPYKVIEAISVGFPLVEPSINYVERQTHEIAWWEDGKKEILY